MHRFYAPALDPGDAVVKLPRGEAEHLTRVLRLGVGDMVSVFDGRGREFSGRVIQADRRDVSVQLGARAETAAEPAVALTLVQAVLKGDRMDDVVRDAVMLGVTAVQPLVTKRVESTIAALLRGGRPDRWQRIALASVKQSRRAVLPDVRLPLTLETFLREPNPDLLLMLVEPDSGTDTETLSALRSERIPGEAAILVGPEGGWTEEERAAGRERGCRLVTLGRRTLRADAVAVAAVSVLQFLWGDL